MRSRGFCPERSRSAESAVQESFSDGLLDWPHYTRPIERRWAHEVPAVLSSGDHAAIGRWRLQQSLRAGRGGAGPICIERRGLSERGAHVSSMNSSSRELGFGRGG